MRDIAVRLANAGVQEHQVHAVQRRIRTVNIISILAFAITVAFSAVFAAFGRAIIGETPWLGFVAGSSLSLVGYSVAIYLNTRHRYQEAAFTALISGTFNLVASVIVVGFASGPAVFFVMVAVGAILITDREWVTLRWTFIVIPVVAYAAMAFLDPPLAEGIADTGAETYLALFNYATLVVFATAVVWYQQGLADTAESDLVVANERSERLLLNILPAPIAERLKDGESPIADRIEHVAVLFADIVGSTPLAERLTADELVSVLNDLFSRFDRLVEDCSLEKVKTIGDSYMVVGGLEPESGISDASVATVALAMQAEVHQFRLPDGSSIEMRFGIASGPVVAGVIGNKKFSYDLWGDTVNTAARMESHGVPGKIQVTDSVRTRLAQRFRFSEPRTIDVRGKGSMTTYFLLDETP